MEQFLEDKAPTVLWNGLLLMKNQMLHPDNIKSILTYTSDHDMSVTKQTQLCCMSEESHNLTVQIFPFLKLVTPTTCLTDEQKDKNTNNEYQAKAKTNKEKIR